MAGVMNHTARQFNLKCMTKDGGRVTVRVAPGFNVVDDSHWEHFVKPKVDPAVVYLVEKGHLSFGKKEDDLEMEQEPDTKSKSKVSPAPKAKK